MLMLAVGAVAGDGRQEAQEEQTRTLENVTSTTGGVVQRWSCWNSRRGCFMAGVAKQPWGRVRGGSDVPSSSKMSPYPLGTLFVLSLLLLIMGVPIFDIRFTHVFFRILFYSSRLPHANSELCI